MNSYYIELISLLTQVLCTAIAAVLQYLLLVAFALKISLSIALYWKLSSVARGIRTDSIRDAAYGLLVSWGEVIFIPVLFLLFFYTYREKVQISPAWERPAFLFLDEDSKPAKAEDHQLCPVC